MKKHGDMVIDDKNKETFPVTHVNIRISIVFLLAKLILLDVLVTFIALLFFGVLSLQWLSQQVRNFILSYNLSYFVVLALIKIFLTLYIVLQWLNEYYEITPKRIYHRRGIFWRREDTYQIKLIRSLGMQQGILGRFFNYGTLFFYDRGVYKYYYLHFIHNPLRYLHILHSILPNVDIEKEITREHIHDIEIKELEEEED